MRILTLAIFLSLIFSISLSGMALAVSENSPSQVCKTNDDFGLSHDTCVVCLAQEGEFFSPTCICKSFQDDGTLDSLGLTLGDCISCIQTGNDCPEI